MISQPLLRPFAIPSAGTGGTCIAGVGVFNMSEAVGEPFISWLKIFSAALEARFVVAETMRDGVVG
jgi:hypothetical protein